MEVVDILKECKVDGNVIKLPDFQIDKILFPKVKKALVDIGGKWKGGKVFGFVFQNDPTTLLKEIAGGAKRNIKKEFQFFATPESLSNKLVEYADLKDTDTVLEPSAGQGSIIKAINNVYSGTPDCFEFMENNRLELEKSNLRFNIIGNDFLLSDDKKYSKIIANPPFAKNQDITHIYKMFNKTKKGGRIVAMTSTHWQLSKNKKETEFKNWLNKLNAEIIKVPTNVFKESGTKIATLIVIINKNTDDNFVSKYNKTIKTIKTIKNKSDVITEQPINKDFRFYNEDVIEVFLTKDNDSCNNYIANIKTKHEKNYFKLHNIVSGCKLQTFQFELFLEENNLDEDKFLNLFSDKKNFTDIKKNGNKTKLNKLKGKEINISMPNGEKHKAQFVIADLDDIIASHNEINFANSKGYPLNSDGSNINDRNYKDDKNAQLQVQSYAKNLEPERIITTSRTPSGTPIITDKGIVVSGNNRTMSLKLAKDQYPENYKAYKSFLLEEAGAFGFVTNDIINIISDKKVLDRDNSELTFNGEKKYIEIKNPVLVRIDYDIDDSKLTTETLSMYNKDTKKAESPIDKTIKLSHILRNNNNCLSAISSIIGESETFSEFYSKIAPQKQLLNKFLECKLITNQEIPMYFEKSVFNSTGKEFIEQVLVASVLNRESLILSGMDGVKNLRQIIITSLPILLANEKLKEGASLNQALNEAIAFQYNLVNGKFKFNDFLRQKAMFNEEKYDYKSVVINRLLNSGRNNFKQSITNYNNAILNEQSNSLFGDTKSNDEIFDVTIAKKIQTEDKAFILASSLVDNKPKADIDNSLELVKKSSSNNDVEVVKKMVDKLVDKYYEPTREEYFKLEPAKDLKQFEDNIKNIVSQYGSRDMAIIQVNNYLNDLPKLGYEYIHKHDAKTKEKFDNHIKYLQSKLRKPILKERKAKDKEFERMATEHRVNDIIEMGRKADAEMQFDILKSSVNKILKNLNTGIDVSTNKEWNRVLEKQIISSADKIKSYGKNFMNKKYKSSQIYNAEGVIRKQFNQFSENLRSLKSVYLGKNLIKDLVEVSEMIDVAIESNVNYLNEEVANKNDKPNLDSMMSIINSKVKNQGYSLKQIYDEVIDAYGSVDGATLFNEYIKRKKDENDKAIIDEFNKTAFVEDVTNKLNDENKILNENVLRYKADGNGLTYSKMKFNRLTNFNDVFIPIKPRYDDYYDFIIPVSYNDKTVYIEIGEYSLNQFDETKNEYAKENIKRYSDNFESYKKDLILLMEGKKENRVTEIVIKLAEKLGFNSDELKASYKNRIKNEEQKKKQEKQKKEDEAKEKIRQSKLPENNKILSKLINYGKPYGILSRKDFIEKVLSEGGYLKVEQVQAIKDVSKNRYDRMDMDEQRAYEKRLKDTKTEYRIYISKYSFYSITKTEYDYGKSLNK